MSRKRALFAGLAVPLMLLPFIIFTNVVRADNAPWRETWIAVVWPHDSRGNPTTVDKSQMVNVSVWPSNQVSCTAPPETNGLGNTRLLVAKDNEPADFFPGDYQVVQRTVAGATFPSLEFNNISADLSVEPIAKYKFVIFTIALGAPRGLNSNVWSHSADPRTFLPQPVLPDGYSNRDVPPEGTDARIQLVWPHDAKGQSVPAGQAPLLNIAVDIFQHGTRKSMPLDTQMSTLLFFAQRNGQLGRVEPPAGNPQQITYTVNGQSYPRWVFNDVPVVPGEQYHFVAGAIFPGAKYTSPYSTIWTHAPDARTTFPAPNSPPNCVP